MKSKKKSGNGKSRLHPVSTPKKKRGAPAPVIELSSVRAKRAADERRRIERFLLKDMLQVFATNGRDGNLYPVEMHEASEDGCSFRIPYNAIPDAAQTFSGPLQLRVYMSQKTYLAIGVDVKNANPMVEEGARYIRFGCFVDKSFASYAAYQQLIRFMEAWSNASKTDQREVSAG